MNLKKIMQSVAAAITDNRYDEETSYAKEVASYENLSEGFEGSNELTAFQERLLSSDEGAEHDSIRALAGSASAAVAFDPTSVKNVMPAGNTEFNPTEQHFMDGEVEDSYESFSSSNPKDLAVTSYGFNYGSAKSDPFTEAFLPTVLKPVGTRGVSITLDIDYLTNDYQRDVTGPTAKMIPIIATYSDANGPLSRNATALTPVSDVEASYDQYFLKPREATVVDEATEEMIKTAPLALGKIVPLLNICQSASALGKGVMDATDTISPDLSVTKIVFEPAAGVYVDVAIDYLRGANFTYGAQGDEQGGVILNFTTGGVTGSPFAIDLNKLKDSAGNLLDTVNVGYITNFRVGVTGTGNLVDGDVEVHVNTFEIVDVRKPDGTLLDAADAVYVDIATKAATAFGDAATGLNAVGYELKAYLVNDNKRRLGRFITRRPKTANYAVKPSSPYTVRSPLKGLDQGKADSVLIPTLVKDVAKETAMSAVLAITRHVDMLRQAVANGVDLESSPVAGVARHVLKPYFKSTTLNLLQAVDSQSSSARNSDITAALVEYIANEVNVMYVQSRYADAVEFTKDSIDVVVGTDTQIARYLPSSFSISEGVNVKVVTTRNSAMKGRVLISFGNHSSSANDEIDPFCFGNRIYVPTLVADSSDNKIREYHVSPIQTFIIHLPVISEIIVTSIPEVTGKVAQWIDTKVRV